jgi:hypothetical protein
MQKYQISHQIELQQCTLELFTQLIKFGVDFSKLDKNQSFLVYVIHQVLGKNSYLAHPPQLLPFMLDFIGSLYIIRRYMPEVTP